LGQVTAGGDTFINFENVIGSNHGDTIIGDAHANTILGGTGNDTIIAGTALGNYYDGGAGTNWLDFQSATSSVTVNLATGVNGGAAAGDTLLNFEVVVGSNHGDLLVAG